MSDRPQRDSFEAAVQPLTSLADTLKPWPSTFEQFEPRALAFEAAVQPLTSLADTLKPWPSTFEQFEPGALAFGTAIQPWTASARVFADRFAYSSDSTNLGVTSWCVQAAGPSSVRERVVAWVNDRPNSASDVLSSWQFEDPPSVRLRTYGTESGHVRVVDASVDPTSYAITSWLTEPPELPYAAPFPPTLGFVIEGASGILPVVGWLAPGQLAEPPSLFWLSTLASLDEETFAGFLLAAHVREQFVVWTLDAPKAIVRVAPGTPQHELLLRCDPANAPPGECFRVVDRHRTWQPTTMVA